MDDGRKVRKLDPTFGFTTFRTMRHRLSLLALTPHDRLVAVTVLAQVVRPWFEREEAV